MAALGALEWTLRLLGVLAAGQGIEFLQLRGAWADDGVWRWPDLRREIAGKSKSMAQAWSLLLGTNGFLFLNVVRIFTGGLAALAPQPWMAVVLLIIHILTLLRWRGSFNGGSDSMCLLLLLAAGAGLWLEPARRAGFAFLWYISLQLLLSYYRSGFVKIKTRRWRDGSALRLFLTSPVYEQKAWIQRAAERRRLMVPASWAIILFEISFPLALLGPRWALAYMGAGISFHLLNAYLLGLNRFFFAWIAAYPALYYCAQ